jgi:hypothetical protein
MLLVALNESRERSGSGHVRVADRIAYEVLGCPGPGPARPALDVWWSGGEAHNRAGDQAKEKHHDEPVE